MGHSVITCGSSSEAYGFGGYSLSHTDLDDLWVLNPGDEEWRFLEPSTVERPSARYHHAAVCVPALRAMYLYGGLESHTGALDSFWKYNMDSNRWSQLQGTGKDPFRFRLPPLAGHTMTTIGETQVLLIGGFSTEYFFNNNTYVFDASSNQWSILSTKGPKPTGPSFHYLSVQSSFFALQSPILFLSFLSQGCMAILLCTTASATLCMSLVASNTKLTDLSLLPTSMLLIWTPTCGVCSHLKDPTR